MAGMADPAGCLRVPGRLVSGPSAAGLTSAFPHGGTALGLVQSTVWEPGIDSQEITAEEFGGEVVEVIRSGESPLLGCVVRGFEDAMVDLIFPETPVGSSSGEETIRRTSATRAGRLGSDDGFVLLFAPREPTVHPGVLFYNAVPIIESVAQVPLGTEDEIGIAVVFRALRDTSGRLYEVMKLEDMTLP